MTETRTSVNSPGQVLFASLIGTTIEFFDFYIYATAAVLVFPRLFFPNTDPAAATPASLATLAIALSAPPVRRGVACRAGALRDRVSRAADRLGAVRTLRRPRRPEDHARRGAADDGRVDR